jgi:hypothetical protein
MEAYQRKHKEGNNTMAQTLEYRSVTRAHQIATRKANEAGNEAAKAAQAEIEAELDPNEPDREKRARILDSALTAAERAWDAAYSRVWDEVYPVALAEAYNEFGKEYDRAPERLAEGESLTFGGELSPRSERRF